MSSSAMSSSSTGQSASAASLSKPDRLQLHVVFKCHLDIGFTDLAANVIDDYLHFYIPRAIAISRRLRELGRPERFIWTTGSWLIHEYFETQSRDQCANLERAIIDGDITWLGLPFTQHSELADAALFEAGLSMSKELDARFGKQTIAAKLTDVPGHTRGIVPLLAAAGIRFLHIGINGACSMPEVPELFIWRDEATQSEVIVMQHGSYGGVHIENGLGLLVDCAAENEPCPSVQAIVPYYLNLRKKYPQADIFGSTLNDYAGQLLEQAGALPVVTQEIGDSWIQGAGADPLKVARLRALMRLHRKWAGSRKGVSIKNYAKKLMLVTEHTWGLDTIMYMSDHTSFAPDIFLPKLKSGQFARHEESWNEQRNYLDQAVGSLGGEDAKEAALALDLIRPWPESESAIAVNPSEVFESKFFTLGFDAATGAICHLKSGNHTWADSNHRLFELSYQRFSAADFDVFIKRYIKEEFHNEWWIASAFGRHDMSQLSAGGLWTPKLERMERFQDAEGDHFVLRFSSPCGGPDDGFGNSLFLRLLLSNAEPRIDIQAGWSEKRPCRYPEAVWLQMNPKVSDPRAWTMDKLGTRISPFDVVRKGGRHLHAVGDDITCNTDKERVSVYPVDAPLVSFGHRGLLCFDNREIDATDGLFFNLQNTVWGTNFPMWYGEPASFRFALTLQSS